MQAGISLERIQNYQQLCYQYVSEVTSEMSGTAWEAMPDGRYRRLAPLTIAIINACIKVGMPYISAVNVEELIYRIELAWDSEIFFFYSDTEEGPMPIPLDRYGIRAHVGLTIDGPSYSTRQFSSMIRSARLQRQHETLF